MEITYQQAIERVCEELRKDDQLFYGFQANIAMPIYDELVGSGHRYKKKLHEACNKGAVEFLRRLTRQVTNKEFSELASQQDAATDKSQKAKS
jgi:hypothetical protein